MDRVIISGLNCYGYHGVRPEEKRLGQRFVVDLELCLDTRAAGERDDLELTVDYARVCRLAREVVEGPGFNLIEAVAERVAARLMHHFQLLEEVTVRISKPGAPIADAHIDRVAVEVVRRRGSARG